MVNLEPVCVSLLKAVFVHSCTKRTICTEVCLHLYSIFPPSPKPISPHTSGPWELKRGLTQTQSLPWVEPGGGLRRVASVNVTNLGTQGLYVC